MSSDSDELDPDEPRTPMWLPLLGSALFLVALMLFLATRSDDEVKAKAEPSDSAAQDANADEGNSDEGAAKRGNDKGDDKGAKPRPPTRKLDPLRRAPLRGSKMVPSPEPSVRVRRIQ